VAIEPDAENFRLLTENTQDYPTIQRLSAGLWHRDGQLETVTHGADGGFLGHWGIQVREAQAAAGTRIPAVTLERILRESREDALDVLKLDVEGAEKEIFSENYEAWLSRTNVVIVELHDRFKPGCREAVFAALGTGDFEHQKQGEFDIFTRKSFR
jgi:FkbM family methyltransferase